MKPVDDVHFSIPRESSEHDMVMPRDISEPSVTAPSSPNPEPIIDDANPALEPVRPDATEHYPPEVFNLADHESQLDIEAKLRRKKKKQHNQNAARVIFLGKGRSSKRKETHETVTVKCR